MLLIMMMSTAQQHMDNPTLDMLIESSRSPDQECKSGLVWMFKWPDGDASAEAGLCT